MPAFFIVVGIIGATGTWLFGIRPFVIKKGYGYRTGANLFVAAWVDWQSCGEIARKNKDRKAMRLYRAFGLFQLLIVLHILLLITGVGR